MASWLKGAVIVTCESSGWCGALAHGVGVQCAEVSLGPVALLQALGPGGLGFSAGGGACPLCAGSFPGSG